MPHFFIVYKVTCLQMILQSSTTHQSLSDGGGGMLMANVPTRVWTSTVRMSGVLDTPTMAFLMYFISVALWKYLDWVILSRYFSNFLPAPPELHTQNKKNRFKKI